jgi:hypothetical protein
MKRGDAVDDNQVGVMAVVFKRTLGEKAADTLGLS